MEYKREELLYFVFCRWRCKYSSISTYILGNKQNWWTIILGDIVRQIVYLQKYFPILTGSHHLSIYQKCKIFPFKLLISVSGCSLSSVSSRRSSSRMPMQEFTGKYVTHTKHKAVFNLNQLILFWRLCSRETWKDLIPFSFLFKENLKRWFGEFLLKCTWTRHMYLKVFHDPLRPNFYKAVTKGCGSS